MTPDKPPTKKELAQIKRDQINDAITGAMHILYESHLFGTTLWPKKGVHAGFKIDDYDTISVTCNINDNYRRLTVNFYGNNNPRIDKQMNAVKLIMDDSTYENLLYTYQDYGTIGCGVGGTWARLYYDFTNTLQGGELH